MAMTRGRPGSPAVRKSRNVGPDYPEDRFDLPWGGGVDSKYGNDTGKTVCSENATTFEGGDLPLHENYNDLWEGK